MNDIVRTRVRQTIGIVLECDVRKDGTGWDPILCERVSRSFYGNMNIKWKWNRLGSNSLIAALLPLLHPREDQGISRS